MCNFNGEDKKGMWNFGGEITEIAATRRTVRDNIKMDLREI
jgi:hypothetical protein